MKIRNSLYFTIAVCLVIPLGYFLIDRTQFVLTAQGTMGTIQGVTATNTRCGRKASKHNCTKFNATLKYEVNGSPYWLEVTAGKARGHDQPKTLADYRIGDSVQVAYDPNNPNRGYRNALWDIWGAPILTFFLQIAMFFGGMKEEQRKSRHEYS
jgi:hypothetical protein